MTFEEKSSRAKPKAPDRCAMRSMPVITASSRAVWRAHTPGRIRGALLRKAVAERNPAPPPPAAGIDNGSRRLGMSPVSTLPTYRRVRDEACFAELSGRTADTRGRAVMTQHRRVDLCCAVAWFSTDWEFSGDQLVPALDALNDNQINLGLTQS